MIDSNIKNTQNTAPLGTTREVFTAFLKLGLTSFGGPIAHLGYFRDEFVTRRHWLDEKAYADLVALCQFLPGPASSQVGFALGLLRGGPFGALAAWAAFTLPSAALLMLFAFSASSFDGDLGQGVISGLKIVAVAIVAQAVLGMSKSLCPDRERATIALGTALIVIIGTSAFSQVAAIMLGALSGFFLCKSDSEHIEGQIQFPISRRMGGAILTLFIIILFGLPILASVISSQGLAVFDAFYRSGSLVFGGGHVVLPLLETEVVNKGWVNHNDFLAGYGATQAMPGPLFTFAAYLGFILQPAPNGINGAAIALVAIFLPGLLLLVGTIPFWDVFRTKPRAAAMMRGANAAVVGILGAALYDPIFVSAINGPYDFALALTCFIFLIIWRMPPWIVVLIGALGGVLFKMI